MDFVLVTAQVTCSFADAATIVGVEGRIQDAKLNSSTFAPGLDVRLIHGHGYTKSENVGFYL